MAGGTDNRLKRKSLPARLRPPPGGPLSTPERTPQRGFTLHAMRSVDPEQLSDDAASALHGRTQPFHGGHEFGLATLAAACSTACAARATGQAPMPRADPVRTWAAADIAGAPLDCIRPINIVA